ncbi:hypothetical protein BDV93DRAFT_478129, partial [Ceratobasidium sp. AG-I]
MALQSPTNKRPAIRHRIKDITLHPNTSKRPIELEILIDNKAVHKFPPVEPGRSLVWDVQTYPCDAYIGASIQLKFIEKHRTSADRDVVVAYIVLDDSNRAPLTKHIGAFPTLFPTFRISPKKPAEPELRESMKVVVEFLNMDEIAKDYSAMLITVSDIARDRSGPLERMGNSRVVLKTIIGFGVVVAEIHPTAKLVVGLCTKAWEHLEKIQGQHDDLQRLISGLEEILPFIESVKGRARENVLQDTIVSLLHLVEDASNFIISDVSRSGAGKMLQGLYDNKTPDRISELLQRFKNLKDNFDRGVGVQVLNQVLSSAQLALLDRLKPSARSHYAGTPPCQGGTRTKILDEIYAWSQDSATFSKLLWVYGQAGMGKSSIASSVCQKLSDQGDLSASFFCKRDDPNLRTPGQILNTLVYNLASQHKPYGQAVASAIENNVQLPDSPIGQRFTYLIVRPLQELELKGVRSIG